MATSSGSLWHALGTPAPTALSAARLQLHWAVQVIAAVPYTHREPVPDDSHTNLAWESGAGRFVARATGPKQVRAALRVSDLTLQLLARGDGVLDAMPLGGATLDDGYRWMAAAVGRHGGGPSTPLARRDYDMPAHPVGEGDIPFDPSRASLEELARWYANAQLVLSQVAASDARAGELRTWPHHFDMATLIELDPKADPETARSINAGFSPGDAAYDEPYFYVTPWPRPPDDDLPTVRSDGAWHTEGFLAAVLPGSRTAVGGAAEQATRTERFLSSALEVCRTLLGDD